MKRRSLLALSAMPAAFAGSSTVLAQTKASGATGADVEVIQLVDKSLLGHDIARDFGQGARCYLQDQQSRGRPAKLGLRLVEVDAGTPERATTWLATAEARSSLGTRPVVFGAFGDALLARLIQSPTFGNGGVLAVPITQDPRISQAAGVLAPYATIDQEIDESIKSLKNTFFLSRLNVVYAQPGVRARLAPVVLAALKTNGVTAIELEETNVANLPRLGTKLAASDAPVTLLLGGTPELATLVQSLGRAGGRRMVVGTSMVDSRTAVELKVGTHGVGVMLTQPVPNPQRGRLPVVAEHVAAWGKFYEEQVTPMTLAGYMAMKWLVLLAGSTGVSADSLRRLVGSSANSPNAGMDIGGFLMRRQAGTSAYVDLVFVREDGRLVSELPSHAAFVPMYT